MKLTINLKEGDRIKVFESYSSYGANEQNDEFIVEIRKNRGADAKKYPLAPFKEDGTRFGQGINSSYEYEIAPEEIITKSHE
jgi:hypothetical protein